ncbi:MAG TPA: PRTRC system protein A [Nevskia sp.]|nr:PRTRC system protein A [Nevskia sp.]
MDFQFADPRDRMMALASPLVHQPRYSPLPPLEPGQQRYIVAANGLFLETRSRAVQACVPVAPGHGLPFGTARARVAVVDGWHVPPELVEHARQLAEAALPNEWAGVILFQRGEFVLKVPEVLAAGRASITYSTEGFDPLDVVMDLHSHGAMPAFFSRQDDRDDRANPSPAFVAVVFGGLGTGQPTTAMRVMVLGRAYDMNLQPHAPGNADEPMPGFATEEP